MAAEDYGQLVDRENINREEAGVDASGMEAAIAALVIGDSSPEDRHPEKCVSCLAACAFTGPAHHANMYESCGKLSCSTTGSGARSE